MNTPNRKSPFATLAAILLAPLFLFSLSCSSDATKQTRSDTVTQPSSDENQMNNDQSNGEQNFSETQGERDVVPNNYAYESQPPAIPDADTSNAPPYEGSKEPVPDEFPYNDYEPQSPDNTNSNSEPYQGEREIVPEDYPYQ
ncbi:hypothetical protein KS4_36460 [Poriferisphaera corsica]|uniref:Uncharacterized protein n=1 Tax=Poriferisphaera corsica TaxID=2528020 RepID=A0A517YZG0_9BACT|nr:hypothetical protein [Poriferisphaera corsica]QDU35563.1 hypothetical protein KS4_36460 [Poriferisphaera corsica]